MRSAPGRRPRPRSCFRWSPIRGYSIQRRSATCCGLTSPTIRYPTFRTGPRGAHWWWRQATELSRYTGQHLIAPQTILTQPYLTEIATSLHTARLTLFHVLLDADDDTVRRRIERSDEARQWRLDHLDMYRAARPWMREQADLVVDTTALRAVEAAHLVAEALPDPRDALLKGACRVRASGVRRPSPRCGSRGLRCVTIRVAPWPWAVSPSGGCHGCVRE